MCRWQDTHPLSEADLEEIICAEPLTIAGSLETSSTSSMLSFGRLPNEWFFKGGGVNPLENASISRGVIFGGVVKK